MKTGHGCEDVSECGYIEGEELKFPKAGNRSSVLG
jgi:hypothetical protein